MGGNDGVRFYIVPLLRVPLVMTRVALSARANNLMGGATLGATPDLSDH